MQTLVNIVTHQYTIQFVLIQFNTQIILYSSTNKLDGVALLVTDPPRGNSVTLQSHSLSNPQFTLL